MLKMDDTIAAISSASVPVGTVGRGIIRLSGPETFLTLSKILASPVSFDKQSATACSITVDEALSVEGWVYAFCGPHSYTGQDLAEIHLDACGAVVQAVLKTICRYVRPAGPGEFTQRAFLNGRMDLTQAEAVAEIVSAANTTQLQAAERLLGGRFASAIAAVRAGIIELMGQLEAGLDFSEEDIEFISPQAAAEKVSWFSRQLSDLLEGSVRCERLIDLDSVGLAGAPNAGKSSLLNALLGEKRSIVSNTEATTRDVLTGVLSLPHLDCVLFDCAGLLTVEKQQTLVDRMSHQASLTALNESAVVLFCVDLGKDDISVDLAMRRQLTAGTILYVATKGDSIDPAVKDERLGMLRAAFGESFLVTSASKKDGLTELKQVIEATLSALRAGDQDHEDRLTLNQRHEQRLKEAVKILGESADEISAHSVEIAAMLLRQAYELLGTLEHENISETILDSVFSRFCIGK